MGEDLNEDHTIECASCGLTLEVSSDVVLAQVVYPWSDDEETLEGIDLYVGEDGEPMYQPLFHCVSCFEEIAEELGLLNKDIPAINNGIWPVSCDYCGSGIPFQENCVKFDSGELVESKRTGLPRFVETRDANPRIMCLSCAISVTGALDDDEDGCGELWPDLSNEDECPRCTLFRCWQSEACACDCHQE